MNTSENQKKGILFVAHGSRRKEANQQVIDLASRLKISLRTDDICVAFMELASPSISDGVKELIGNGISEIVVYPYFLFRGIHTTSDVPEILDKSIQDTNKNVTWRMMEPVGVHPGVYDCVRESLVSEIGAFQYESVLPEKIEDRSMEIIEEELFGINIPEKEKFIVKRVIHTTGDFSFLNSLRFHPDAVETGLRAVREKRPIFTDVSMVASGINKKHGHDVRCILYEPEVAELSQKNQITKSEAAMLCLGEKLNGAIIAIGNAPTALRRVVELINKENIRPGLIIGTPVGFVNALESKTELIKSSLNCPFITNVSRRGGSAVAAAIVNALIKKEFVG